MRSDCNSRKHSFDRQLLLSGSEAGCSAGGSFSKAPFPGIFPYNLSVTDQLLKTKLYIPPLRPNLVPRPELIERLNQGLEFGHKLSLISAPAGFGKTTLVSEWLAASKRPAAWLSLDQGDNDPRRFLTYLIAALQTIEADVGLGALAMLQSPQPPSTESILTTLLNELAVISDHLVLVLDDYHMIEVQAIDEALGLLLEYLPPQMHLAIASREDPPLPLASLRARGLLTELRASDLRFTAAEAAVFLNQMGLDLSPDDVAALESRTEGWIAGLQMAALALQGPPSGQERADTASFIQAFTGSHRFVLDYLVEEVLGRQSEEVRSFLLQTSILDRLSGPLCDAVRFGVAERPSSSERRAVYKREDGKKMLQALERGNLFVVPLDDRRQWYRYHHLFAGVLQAHLKEEQPDQVPALHLRASEWYQRNGRPSAAVRHALAAEDYERAADLIELAWPEMDGRFQSKTWLAWAKRLPAELIPTRPVLSAAYAWALLNGGELEAAESRLQDAAKWLEPTGEMSEGPELSSIGMVVTDEDQFRALPASIASAQAFIAQARGDVPSTVKYARQALERLPEDDYVRRGPAAALLGLAYWGQGELEAAHQTLAEAMAGFQKAGAISFAISGTYGLADIQLAQGRLRAAISTYEQSLQLVREQDDPAVIRGTADLYLGLSKLFRERGESEAAEQNLLKSEELGEQAALEDWPYRWRIYRALVQEDQGDLNSALDLLDEAGRFYFPTPVPNLRPVTALKTGVWLKQGRLAEALDWASQRELSAENELSYLREFEHLTLARVLMAQYEAQQNEKPLQEAMGLLKRLQKAAEAGGRRGSVIEILVLQALAQRTGGEISPALVALGQALALAEPEGYVRIFVDEGPPMARLLNEALSRGMAPGYVQRLLATFSPDGLEQTNQSMKKSELRIPKSELIDPLSKRELEVLRLLGTELSGPEIARELMVSLTTIRTHTQNIYSKLGVHNRRSAVSRAEELDLL